MLKAKIEAALAKLRPSLERDGAAVELVRVNAQGDVAEIRFSGGCGG